MNPTHKQKPLAEVVNSRFANPRLAEIAEFFQVRKGRGLWYSLLIELLAVCSFVFGLVALTTCLSLVITLPLTLLDGGLQMLGVDAQISIRVIMFLAMACSNYLSYALVTKLFFKLRRQAKTERVDAMAHLSTRAEDPVLYLRSFEDDNRSNPSSRSQKTYEEDLALALNQIGPVIAIGNPNEETPTLGATRIYLKHEHWQENVRRLMQIARLVVIQAGTTYGVIWELERILESVEPRKVIMSFLSWTHLDEEAREREYALFKTHVEEFMRHSPSPVFINLPTRIGRAAFLVFSEAWIPQPIEISRFKKIFYKFSSYLIISETIRPALNSRNLKLGYGRKAVYMLFVSWIIISSILLVPTVLALGIIGANPVLAFVITLFFFGPTLIIGWLVPNIFIFFFRKIKSIFTRPKPKPESTPT